MAAAEKWGQNKTENLSRGVTAANPFYSLYIRIFFAKNFFSLSEMKLFSAPKNVDWKSLKSYDNETSEKSTSIATRF